MTTFVGYFDQVNRGLADKMEDQIGVGFRAIRLNNGFNHGTEPAKGGNYLNEEYDRIVKKYGVAPRGFWNMNLDPPLTFGTVAAGDYEEIIRARAVLIKENPRFTHDTPLFVSPHHEQSVDTTRKDSTDPDSDNQPGGGEPEDYPAFFKYVHDIFADEGILRNQGGSVMLCFVPTVGQFLPENMLPAVKKPWAVDKIAPDPKLYQYAGCDIYSKPQYKRVDARELDNVNAWAKKVGKKFIIGECGASVTREVGKQAMWVDDVYRRLKSYGNKASDGGCNMVCWTFKDFEDGTSTRVDQVPLAMQAMTNGMLDKFFQRDL